MVHTAKFYIILDDKDIFNLKKEFKEDITLISCILDKKYKGIKTTFIKKFCDWFMFVTVNFIQLIDKPVIVEGDYKQVEYKLNNFLNLLGFTVNDLVLIRIDYRMDAKIKSIVERQTLIYLYKKLVKRYRFKTKYIKYQTTVYFNSKSKQSTCYDKEAERISKGKDIQGYQKDLLRFEVRIQNRHLNYIKRKYKIEKRLENYFKNDFYKKYMREDLGCFIYKGDYYKIYVAEKIISSSILKEREKTSLREFLVEVSKNQISGAMSKYTKYKFNKYIRILESLNINPVLIPKNLKAPSIIKNPFNIN